MSAAELIKKQSYTKILIADDETDFAESLAEQLSDFGYQVETAKDGAEALQKFKLQKFHLVISDVKMPNMGGLDLLRSVKEIDADTEVILVTGHESSESAISALKFGAFAYLVKPFQWSDFLHTVERALEKKELRALVALYEASHLMFHKQPLQQVLNKVLMLVQKVLNADEGAVLFLDPQNQFYVAATCGAESEKNNSIFLKMAGVVAAKSFEERSPYLAVNGLENHSEFKWVASDPHIQSSIICPLVYLDQLVGVLTMNRFGKGHNFTESDLRNACIFSTQVAMAVINGKLVDSLEKKIEELGGAYMTLETTKDRLVQSEKMATVGKLVSGVAHEINNPLTAVLGYSQLMLSGELPDNIRQQLSIVFKEADRCKRIIQDMLTFARARKPKMIRMSPVSVLIESANTFAKEIENHRIVTGFSFEGKEISLTADPQQLNQVFVNIIRNACVALSELKGVRLLQIKSSVNEGHFEVIIHDNGLGIAPENLNRIFDPFFTTRDVGQGTGLGLSIAYGIVQEHRGTIEVESRPEEGTRFKIRFPLGEVSVAEKGIAPGENTPAPVVAHKRRLSLLVIEDEPIVLGFMKMVLETVGHKIESAKDGAEALERLKSKQYDLAVCDFRLPKMDGREVYTTIKTEVPAYKDKFIFATGSVRGGEMDDIFFKQMGIPVLSKPFTAKELIDAVDSKAGKLYP